MAVACSCYTPPPCQAFSSVNTVFVGTVTEALEMNAGRISRARMRVDRVYKGASQETLILVTDYRACADPDLQVGGRYMIYADRLESGDVASAGCSRSGPLIHAEEDLKYLDNLRDAAPTGFILGNVVRRDETHGDEAAVGARVEVRGPDGTRQMTVDGGGKYYFDGLKPGTYSIMASQPGFRLASEARGATATVAARGCDVVNLALRKDWPSAIEGRVTSSEGTSAPSGIGVTLIPVQPRDDEYIGGLFRAETQTDDNGEYSFRAVPPGRYKIGINLYGPTPDAPYLGTYWPSASTEAASGSVEIRVGVAIHCDFRLAPRLKTTVVEGIVVRPDGEPAAGARVELLRKSDNSISGEMPTADAAGHFLFRALEGFEYNLIAVKEEKESDALPFSLDKGPQVIKLVLDYPTVIRQ
jgi:hypothetical protein